MTQKENSMTRLFKRGVKGTKLSLALLVSLAMLTGCAQKQLKLESDCPQLPRLPASLSESNSHNVQSFSKEASRFSGEVSSWLKNLR